MILSDRIQQLIRVTEDNTGGRWLKYLVGGLLLLGLFFTYDLVAYRGFASPEAMDAAQVGRNLAEGKGFSTLYVRPFSIYLLREHNQAKMAGAATGTNVVDLAQLEQPHPDLANAPVYPTLLAGMWKIMQPDWKVKVRQNFWTESGSYRRYPPEFCLALCNQFLLLVVVWLTYSLARKLFDPQAALLAALLTLCSDVLLKFSVSGLSTMLLLVVFLGVVLCLVKFEEAARDVAPNVRRLFGLALTAGLLLGVGMLTRYSFGWLILPVVVYLVLFGGPRRSGLAVTAGMAFVVVVTPWIIRNLAVSGTLFGTAGYAVAENTAVFPGSRLMQSLNPNLNLVSWVSVCLRKFIFNSRLIFQGGLVSVAGVWVGVLFFAGLLLGLRNVAARRLRYFTLMCLAVLFVVQALGQTGLAGLSPEFNTENLLVLLAPLFVIFAVVFFLTLLDQMRLPAQPLRYVVIVVMALVTCQPLIATLLPPRTSPVVYPPYYPPEIQRMADWMKPEELMMSDIPWAVAWYGNRQCAQCTVNSQVDFFQLNDYNKSVKALYLTLVTLDSKLFTECLQGGVDSWGNFALKTVAGNQIPPSFPLKTSPYGLNSGLFLTDHVRWETAR